MKHIILEGQDNLGKNELIKQLCLQVENYTVRHFSKPIGNTIEEKIKFQQNDFKKAFRLVDSNIFLDGKTEYYIWNRSHIGEWPLSILYRNNTPNWIWDLEKEFKMENKSQTYLIFLYATPEFLVEKDDGKSFSVSVDDKIKELQLYEEAIDKSIIQNKLKICVDLKGNGYNCVVNDYIPKNEIFKKVQNFIK